MAPKTTRGGRGARGIVLSPVAADASDNDNKSRVESEDDGEDEKELEDDPTSVDEEDGDDGELEEEDEEDEGGDTTRINVTTLQDEEDEGQSVRGRAILCVEDAYAIQDMELEEDGDPEDDELSNESEPPAQIASGSRLKIKLKLPIVPASSTSNTATPVPEEYRQVSPSKRTSGRSRKVVGIYLSSSISQFMNNCSFPEYLESSEDEVSDDDMSISEESTQASPNKRLTSRQAALANAGDTTHVSLSMSTIKSFHKRVHCCSCLLSG